jgi:hypothetical protein
VQAGISNRRGRLGYPPVGSDPCHYRREVGALGEDRGAFNDRAAGGMRARKPRHQSANRVVVHSSHPSRSPRNASDSLSPPSQRPRRLTRPAHVRRRCRFSSAAGAPPTCTRTLALGLKRVRGALRSARCETAPDGVEMRVTRAKQVSPRHWAGARPLVVVLSSLPSSDTCRSPDLSHPQRSRRERGRAGCLPSP